MCWYSMGKYYSCLWRNNINQLEQCKKNRLVVLVQIVIVYGKISLNCGYSAKNLLSDYYYYLENQSKTMVQCRKDKEEIVLIE